MRSFTIDTIMSVLESLGTMTLAEKPAKSTRMVKENGCFLHNIAQYKLAGC